MTVYSPDQHRPNQNDDQRQLLSVQLAPNGQISFTVTAPPEFTAIVGNALSAFLAASGNVVVPSGFQPPPTPADAEKQRFEARCAEVGRENRRIGRIASSQHRKLAASKNLSWYEAAKQIAPSFLLPTETLKIHMKAHREARDARVQKMRMCLVHRLSDAGLSDIAIGKRLNVHPKTIGTWRKKAKHKRNALRQENSQ